MNDNHEGPVPPGAGRWCFDSTRCTTFLSMSIPNVCERMRAIRGQPNRGLRDLSSTMARMRASSGPFGPGFLRHGPDENSNRYLHQRLMKRQDRRGAEGDGEFSNAAWIEA